MADTFELDHGLVTLTEVDADGFLGMQIDVPGEKQGACEAGEVESPYGLYARPHDPELDAEGEPLAAKSCGAIYGYYGGRLHVWPHQDPRAIAKLPRLKKGGSILYGGRKAQPAFLHFDGESGSLDGYVPYDFAGDTPSKAMAIVCDVRNAGAESLGLVHGEGMAVLMTAGGKNSLVLRNRGGSAYVEVNDDGTTVAGPLKAYGGLDVGGGILPIPAALAVPLLSYIASLEALLASLAAQIDAKNPPPPPGPPPATTAVTSFIAASVSLKAKIPATTLTAV